MFWKICGTDQRKALICPPPIALTIPAPPACPLTSRLSVFYSKGLFIVFCLSFCLEFLLLRILSLLPHTSLHGSESRSASCSSQDSSLCGIFLISTGSSPTLTLVLPSALHHSFQGRLEALVVSPSFSCQLHGVLSPQFRYQMASPTSLCN